jgi:hypothetical protein
MLKGKKMLESMIREHRVEEGHGDWKPPSRMTLSLQQSMLYRLHPMLCSWLKLN